jgi:hypothetical protein
MTTPDPYDPAADAETFDLDAYLAQFDERLLLVPEGRRVLTEHDPLLFALVYLRDHLRSEETGNRVTIGDMHLRWAREARRWSTELSRHLASSRPVTARLRWRLGTPARPRGGS